MLVLEPEQTHVDLWDINLGIQLPSLKEHNKHVTDAKFNKAEDRVATASYDNTVKIWKTDGELLRTIRRPLSAL